MGLKEIAAQKLAEGTAKFIGKNNFLQQLKPTWKEHLSKDFNVDKETELAWGRVIGAKQVKLFSNAGVTKEDLRNLLQEIKDENLGNIL